MKRTSRRRRKRRLHLVMHDFEPGWDTYKESPGYAIESDVTFDDVRVGDYEAVMCIGGRAPEYLRNDARVLAILREFDAQQKWIFSICHGIQLVAAAGLAKGKRFTCYEHVRLEVEAVGGHYVDRRDGDGRPPGVVPHLARAPGVLPRRLRLPATNQSAPGWIKVRDEPLNPMNFEDLLNRRDPLPPRNPRSRRRRLLLPRPRRTPPTRLPRHRHRPPGLDTRFLDGDVGRRAGHARRRTRRRTGRHPRTFDGDDPGARGVGGVAGADPRR